MVLIRSQVSWGVFVTAFVVLLCVDLACRAEDDIIQKLVNIGDDITLSCSRPDGVYENYISWYRNGTLLANRDGFVINDPRFIQGSNTNDGRADSNNIYISNIRMNDSATFECIGFYNDTFQSYDLRVIRCSNCITANPSDATIIKMNCTLDNYWTSQMLYKYIMLTGITHAYRRAIIQGNTFSFWIYVSELNRLHSEFRLQTEPESRITCMLSTQRTPPSSPTTTLPTTSFKQTTQNGPSSTSYAASKNVPVGRPTSIPTTKYHTPTNKHANPDNRTTTLPTTSLKQTTQNRPSTLSYTASKKMPVGTPTSPNVNSSKNKRDGNITMIVVILGSAFILILIVIIIVLRRKQLSHPEYPTSIQELRESNLDQRRADHPGNGEMADDIVYDSADMIEESSITRIEGPLDNALYTMPDKRSAISREQKYTSKVAERSSNSDHLYGNSVIITEHGQNRDTLQQGDQYKNVKLPGSGDDAEEIPLYDMPDEGLMRNTLKATPEAGLTSTLLKDEVVSVDALYAEVDKTKKK